MILSRAVLAAALAGVTCTTLAAEVEIALSADGDRFMLVSETVKEHGDGTRYAQVYSYADGQRNSFTFMVAGCDEGFGRATYGVTGEAYENAVKVTWTAAGNKVFDRISYAICRQPATAAQLQQSPRQQQSPARSAQEM
jgi:hypothetical protein